MVEEIIIGFYGASFGAVIGSLVAFLLTRYNLSTKERKELKKLQNILSDDFFRNYKYALDTKEFLIKIMDNKKQFQDHCDDTLHEISRGRNPVIFSLPNFRFLLWDAIITSNFLIKLESEEIQWINSSHADMQKYFEYLYKQITQFEEKFYLSENNPITVEYDKVISSIIALLLEMHSILLMIENSFEELHKNIPWIKKEFSTYSTNELNEGFYDIPTDQISVLSMRGIVDFYQGDKPLRKTPI